LYFSGSETPQPCASAPPCWASTSRPCRPGGDVPPRATGNRGGGAALSSRPSFNPRAKKGVLSPAKRLPAMTWRGSLWMRQHFRAVESGSEPTPPFLDVTVRITARCLVPLTLPTLGEGRHCRLARRPVAVGCTRDVVVRVTRR